MSEVEKIPLFDWIQGCKDCKTGVPHQDKGEWYNKGYAFQYELEQVDSKGFN